ALRLISIFGRKPNVDVLTWKVALPTVHLQQKTFYARSFDNNVADFGHLPLESLSRRGRVSRRHISALSMDHRSYGTPSVPRIRARRVPQTVASPPIWRSTKSGDVAQADGPAPRARAEWAGRHNVLRSSPCRR